MEFRITKDYISNFEDENKIVPSFWMNLFKNLHLSIYLILFNLFLFLLSVFLEDQDGLWRLGTLNQILVTYRGEYFRFITAIFLHAHEFYYIHFILNMFSLFMVGPFIEDVFGKVNFFVLYMFSGLTASFASYFITAAPNALGASGAIFGIVGGFTTFLLVNKSSLKPKVRKRLLINIFVVLALNLGIGFFSGLPIDNAGHVGGLISGAFIAFFLKAEILYGKQKGLLIWSLAIFFTVLIIGSFIWGGYLYLYESRDILNPALYF